MLDFLRDPIWQFLGSFIGLIALVITTWISLKGRAKKLNYEVISQTSLLNFDLDSTIPKLTLLFGNNPIHNAEIVLIRISNEGSVPIRPREFEYPLKLAVGETSSILDAKLVRKHPDNLVVKLSLKDSKFLAIDPLLLNPGDYFLIQIIAMPEVNIRVKGRIAGIREIKSEAHKRKARRVMTTIFVGIVSIAIGVWILSGFSDYQTPFLIMAAGFSTFFGGVVLPRLIDWIRDNTR
jgi:hypothetical protein